MEAVVVNGYTHYIGPFTVDENMYLNNKVKYERTIMDYLAKKYPVDENTKENQQQLVKLLERLYILSDDREKYKKDAILNMINTCNIERWWC